MEGPRQESSAKGVVCGLLVFVLMIQGCTLMPKRPDFTAGTGYEVMVAYLNNYIERSMKKNKVVGLSIALVDDQEVVWARGFGYADLAEGIPATKNTLYRVGSISKLITATAVMQLAQAGHVDIDAPVNVYLPEFTIKSRFPDTVAITARNIMTHHSGLPSDYLRGMYTRKPESLEQLIAGLKDEYTAFPPDFVFSYSNLGMSILGRLIEELSARSFADYMEHEVLVPMGMDRSSFVRRDDLEGLYAKGYHNRKEQELFCLRDMPAGSLYSNVVDMSRFMKMIFAGGRAGDTQIVSPETLARMLSVQNSGIPLDLDLKIGLNWMISEKPGVGAIIGHDGSAVAFFSEMYAITDRKLAAIVLTNCVEGADMAGQVCMEALESLFEAKIGRPFPGKKEPSPGITLNEAELATYEGYYDTVFGVTSIGADGNKLTAVIKDRSLILEPRQDGTFSVSSCLFGFLPRKTPPFDEMVISFQDVAGRRVMAGNRNDTLVLMGTRISPVAIPPAWLKRMGRYINATHGDDGIYIRGIELRMEDGFLLADATMAGPQEYTMTLALEPLSDSQAVVMGLGRNRGNTYSATEERGWTTLHACGYDFRISEQE